MLTAPCIPFTWHCIGLVKQATCLSFNQICGRRTAPASVWSTTRYGMSSSSESLSRRCATLANRSRDRLASGMALTIAALRMQMTSGWIAFEHANGQIMDTKATDMTVLIFTQPYATTCFILVAHDMTLKLCLLKYLRNSNLWIPKVKQQHN